MRAQQQPRKSGRFRMSIVNNRANLWIIALVGVFCLSPRKGIVGLTMVNAGVLAAMGWQPKPATCAQLRLVAAAASFLAASCSGANMALCFQIAKGLSDVDFVMG